MSGKPKLLVLASTFPRWQGDSEPRFIYDLCIQLQDSFDLIVLAPHCRDSAQQELMDGFIVKRFRYAPESLEKLAYEGGIAAKLKRHFWMWGLVPLLLIGQLLAIIRILRSQKVSVIHSHWLIPQGLVAVLSNKLTGSRSKILCTSHGGDLFGFRDQLSIRLKKFVLKNADAVTVVSQPMVDSIRQLDPDIPIHVAPMGVDLQNQFFPDSSVRIQAGQIFFVGRLVDGKGVKYLIKALPVVLETFPDARLLIVGGGPAQNSLLDLTKKLGIEPQVQFVGSVTHSALVHYLRSSELVVLPFAEAEGLGLTVIEAMGCQCPVIVGNVPSIHDIVIDGVTGYIVDAQNTQRLALTIQQVLGSSEKSKSMAVSGRQQVLSRFDWPVVGERHLQILDSLDYSSEE